MRQAQVQKDMKDEMERLRSQMLFKVRQLANYLFLALTIFIMIQQQELDSSVMRKLPGSVRAKKVGREYPSTPLAVPSTISSWNRGASQSQNFKGLGDETPLRPSRPPQISKQSPSKPPRKSPEKNRKAMLPGFHNAFETSVPVRSPSKKIVKSKSNADPDSNVFDVEMSQLSYAPSQPMAGPSQGRFLATGLPSQSRSQNDFPSGPEVSQVVTEDLDVPATESDEDVQPEAIDTFDPINWKAEVCDLFARKIIC